MSVNLEMLKSKGRGHVKTEEGKVLQIVEAPFPLKFEITQSAVDKAVCGDPSHCVIAEAFKEAFGVLFEEIWVGSKITKILTQDKVYRYGTPDVLSKALKNFDLTGKWSIPLGTYYLSARACARLDHKHKKTDRKLPPRVIRVRGKRLASPTRRVPLACQVANREATAV